MGGSPSDVEAVRLLLTDHHRCRRHWEWREDTEWAWTYRELVQTLAVLDRERPSESSLLRSCWLLRPAQMTWSFGGEEHGYEKRAPLLGFQPRLQRRIDHTLSWIVSRMATPVALPPWHRADELPATDVERFLTDSDAYYDEPDEEWRSGLPPDWDPQSEPRVLSGLTSASGAGSIEPEAPDEDVRQLPAKPAPMPIDAARRPRTASPIAIARVGELLVREAGDSDLDHLRSLLRRGRPARADRELRRQLAIAIYRLRQPPRVPVSTLAKALDCDAATIWRQVQRGRSATAAP